MRDIAMKMERVDLEFQKRDVTILKLDGKLQEAKKVVQSLSKKTRDADDIIEDRNSQIRQLEQEIEKQKQLADVQELKEFLHVENQALSETLADAEQENAHLKDVIEAKNAQLDKSEDQCRHLVRINEQRHQQILYVTAAMEAVQTKAKDIIIRQVIKWSKMSTSGHPGL